MEAEKLSSWNRLTGILNKDVMIFAIAGICYAFFAIIPMCGWLSSIGLVGLTVGLTAFYLRLGDLAALAEEADAASLKKLALGVLIFIGGIAISNIPVIGGFLSAAASVVAFVFMFMAFGALKTSASFPGAEGAKLLSIACIIGIVVAVLFAIPVVGIVGKLAYVAAFILFIMGWKKIAAPAA